jgi:hypothetical protein
MLICFIYFFIMFFLFLLLFKLYLVENMFILWERVCWRMIVKPFSFCMYVNFILITIFEFRIILHV